MELKVDKFLQTKKYHKIGEKEEHANNLFY
jgi:hypothetical protein